MKITVSKDVFLDSLISEIVHLKLYKHTGSFCAMFVKNDKSGLYTKEVALHGGAGVTLEAAIAQAVQRYLEK